MRSRGTLGPVEAAVVEWSDRGEPRSPAYQDGYFSSDGGLAESTHVFLEGNQLPARFARARRGLFTVGETGFGTGLNFLLTVRAFLATAPATQRLHYWSVDRHPLRRDDLRRALALWPELAREAGELCRHYPPLLPGVHRRLLFDGRVTLDLVWADGRAAVEDLAALAAPTVDAWHLDGFAPRHNPDLWHSGLFRALASASRDGATVATYSVASVVRRGLEDAGFSIAKRPGFGRKRECLAAQLERRPAPTHRETPWDLSAAGASPPERALILGAGLAGAHAAAALARRGVQVDVFDTGPTAGRASGNPQGVLFTRLSPQRSPLADFSLTAALYAANIYGQMFDTGLLETGRDGDLNGCVQLGDQATRVPPEQLAELREIARPLSELEAAQRLGTPVHGPALWLENSGWLNPGAVCAALLGDPLIRTHEHCGVLTPQRSDDGESWNLVDDRGATVAQATVLILATGAGTRGIPAMDHLPLRTVRGQTTQLPAIAALTLRCSCCHSGYIAPAMDGAHCIGATFDPKDDRCDLRPEDNRENLDALAQALPAWADHLRATDSTTLTGRAELRCVSPDYLPLAGPLPRVDAMEERFAALGHDARQIIPETGAFEKGLYLSTAHGSRGLSYAALAAELIASDLFGEPRPLARDIQRALAPARFLIRAMIRRESR